MRGRSSDLVVHSSFDVNFWIDRVPSVEVARPSCCVRCGFASRVPGRPLGIVGHGLRERQLRGPPSPAEPSCTRTIRARRYLCRACQAVMTVVPRDVAGRRHFTAGAIGLALFVYGKLRAAASDVAARVGLWGRGPGAWRTIRRWLAAVEDGRLFRGIRSSPPGWPPRRRAERAAMTLVARAVMPETTPEEARVFAGAAVAT